MKIYILHGWAYETSQWQPFIHQLEDMGFESLTLKIPGLTAKLNEPWGIDDYVEWLSKELPEEPVVLLGHSNGGRIAMNFAINCPERVDQLILVDSAGIMPGAWGRFKRASLQLISKFGKKITKSKRVRALFHKLIGARDYHEASANTKKILANLLASDRYLDASRITVPTLIIWGALDTTTPLKDGVLIHSLIENSRFELINQARHSPMFSHPDEVAQLIEAALE